jgi:hypothetical protein
MDIIEVNLASLPTINKYEMIDQFTKIAEKNPYARTKLNCCDKNKCDSSDCIKYAMYHYVLDNKNLCWHHALCYKKN